LAFGGGSELLSQIIIDQLQFYDFDRLARKEKDGSSRLSLIARSG
jgi:DNA invertase Pin-like site-specific DNA recombinase